MSEKCAWITFSAHPTKFVKEDDNHPDYFGVFVCPLFRTEPESLLTELLSHRKLLLTEINDNVLKPMSVDWGLNERLKSQLAEQGYALSLTKMHQRPIALS